MEENPVEQISVVKCIRLRDNLAESSTEIMDTIECAYSALYRKAQSVQKVLIGVNQAITHDLGVYVIALVGSAVDAQLVEQQKRMNQFGLTAHPKPRGVN